MSSRSSGTSPGELPGWALGELKSYLQEFTCKSWLPVEGVGEASLDDCPGARDAAAVVARSVNENDVAIFVKVGCGFCARAKAELKRQTEERAKQASTFTVAEVVGTSPEFRCALRGGWCVRERRWKGLALT